MLLIEDERSCLTPTLTIAIQARCSTLGRSPPIVLILTSF